MFPVFSVKLPRMNKKVFYNGRRNAFSYFKDLELLIVTKRKQVDLFLSLINLLFQVTQLLVLCSALLTGFLKQFLMIFYCLKELFLTLQDREDGSVACM